MRVARKSTLRVAHDLFLAMGLAAALALGLAATHRTLHSGRMPFAAAILDQAAPA